MAKLIYRTSACKSCNASIIWVRTTSGKAMPIDARPTVAFVIKPNTMDPQSPIGESVSVHHSHFATCPNADQHRKRGG